MDETVRKLFLPKNNRPIVTMNTAFLSYFRLLIQVFFFIEAFEKVEIFNFFLVPSFSLFRQIGTNTSIQFFLLTFKLRKHQMSLEDASNGINIPWNVFRQQFDFLFLSLHTYRKKPNSILFSFVFVSFNLFLGLVSRFMAPFLPYVIWQYLSVALRQ